MNVLPISLRPPLPTLRSVPSLKSCGAKSPEVSPITFHMSRPTVNAAATTAGCGSCLRLLARNRELELQLKVNKLVQATLRVADAEGARWSAPSLWVCAGDTAPRSRYP